MDHVHDVKLCSWFLILVWFSDFILHDFSSALLDSTISLLKTLRNGFCFRFGIKGKVDMTVDVKVKPTSSLKSQIRFEC